MVNMIVDGLTQEKYLDINTDGTINIKNKTSNPSATFTRPSNTNTYDALDVVGNTGTAAVITFANVATIAGQTIRIDSAKLRIDLDAVPAGMTTFKLHLYNAAPTALADETAFDVITADKDKYLGYITFTAPEDLGSRLYSKVNGLNFITKLVTTSLYGQLQTVGTYAGASASVHTIDLNVSEV